MSMRLGHIGTVVTGWTPKQYGGLVLVMITAACAAADETMIPAMRLDVAKPVAAAPAPPAAAEHAAMQELLDGMLQRLRQGETLSDADRARCGTAFSQYARWLHNRQTARSNYLFTEPDRTDYYLNTVRMAFIDWQQHGGWPLRSALRKYVVAEIQRRLAASYDPFLEFSTLFAIIQSDRAELAVPGFRRIREADPFLADTVIDWCAKRFGHVNWLVEDLLKRGDREAVLAIASKLVAADSPVSLEAAGQIYERLEDHDTAEAVYRQAEDSLGYPGALADYYARRARPAAADAAVYRERLDALWDRHYPNGVQHVSVEELGEAPQAGIILRSESSVTAANALNTGTIIVAIDGVRIENLRQYYVARDVNREKSPMDLIVWRNDQYEKIAVTAPNRRLMAMVEDYTARPRDSFLHSVRDSLSDVIGER